MLKGQIGYTTFVRMQVYVMLCEGVERRIAEWTMVPMENGEGIQVLKYDKSEKYDSHFDYFFHKVYTSPLATKSVAVAVYFCCARGGTVQQCKQMLQNALPWHRMASTTEETACSLSLCIYLSQRRVVKR